MTIASEGGMTTSREDSLKRECTTLAGKNRRRGHAENINQERGDLILRNRKRMINIKRNINLRGNNIKKKKSLLHRESGKKSLLKSGKKNLKQRSKRRGSTLLLTCYEVVKVQGKKGTTLNSGLGLARQRRRSPSKRISRGIKQKGGLVLNSTLAARMRRRKGKRN